MDTLRIKDLLLLPKISPTPQQKIFNKAMVNNVVQWVKIQWKNDMNEVEATEMEVFCRMCGVSSDESIVNTRAEFGDVLCQACYEKRLDEWARSFREG
jgi:hypothetical protein